MAKVPIGQLKKQEIIELYKGRCKHGHRYLEHYGCYLEEAAKPLRVGFLDIETSNLKADFGIVFCYVIKEAGQEVYHERLITSEDMDTSLDKKVIAQAVEDMKKFDVLVTHYGTKFDIPFLRTRALYLGLDFPGYGLIHHKDTYYMVKSKLKLSRNTLDAATRLLVGKTEKNRIDSDKWIKALRGDKKSLEYILDHCRRDVRDLERIYRKMLPFVQNINRSI